MRKIIGIGNALVDVLVHLDDEQQLQTLGLAKGGMVHITRERRDELQPLLKGLKIERATGGSAANTIHALALLGNETGYIGAVGNDELGRFFSERSRERGIEARLSIIPDEPTGTATTFITPDRERTFATHLGAAARLNDDIKPEQFSGYDILHIEGYLLQDQLLIENILRTAKQAGLLVSYDLASWNIVREHNELIHRLVEDYVDIVFANEEEATAFSGHSDPNISLQYLGELTTIAVVKTGKHGAQGQHNVGKGSEFAFSPSLKKTAVDTTAAGDFFAAGFLHAFIRGKGLRECLDCGNLTASEVIQVIGTQVDPAKMKEISDLETESFRNMQLRR